MLKDIWTEIRKINIFGRDFQFEKDYSSKFNSLSGFVLTMIIFIGTVIVGFIFGQEIYKRKNPKLTSSKTTIDESDSTLNFLEFPIIFKVLSNEGQILEDSIIRKNFILGLYEFELQESKYISINQTEMSLCDLNLYKLSKKFEIISEIINTPGSSYCINPNKEIMNKKAGFNSKNMIVFLSKCQLNCNSNIVA